MILRHEREPVDGQPIENTFVAIDERSGETLSSSVIYVDYNPTLYPVRPLQVRIQLDGAPVPESMSTVPPRIRGCWRASRPSDSRTTMG